MPAFKGTKLAPDTYVPLLEVSVDLPTGRFQGLALVDSGADATVFSSEVIQAFGVDVSSLTLVGYGRGAGGRFRQRECRGWLRFRERAFADRFVVAETELDYPLLGRADFFRCFRVQFEWNRRQPQFSIEP